MNEKQREAFWSKAKEYEGLLPSYRMHDEWFYIACDTAYRPIDAETLRAALATFHSVSDGDNCAIYLIRNGEWLATYNGLQSEPYGETTYHVTKSALGEWLAVADTMR